MWARSLSCLKSFSQTKTKCALINIAPPIFCFKTWIEHHPNKFLIVILHKEIPFLSSLQHYQVEKKLFLLLLRLLLLVLLSSYSFHSSFSSSCASFYFFSFSYFSPKCYFFFSFHVMWWWFESGEKSIILF